MSLSGSKAGRQETIFALSASLAMHVGIFLILFTATAMSTDLKLWEDPVFHISLVSMAPAGESKENLKPPKLQYHRHNSEGRLTGSAVMVSIDKPEENTIKVEKALPHTLGGRAIDDAMWPMVGSLGTEARKKAKTIIPNAAERHSQGTASSAISAQISIAIPRYRDNTQPIYPRIARLRGYEGVVVLAAEIHADGQVGSLKVKKSSGFDVLDQSALKTVKTWKFEPGKRIDEPVNMWVDVPVKFVLKDDTPVM